ncbi:hypothetical protein [Palaeococcus ferrophilus]|uniref:hypothetical protein n=1 Tax=Palaeococcus ferrophilus TaxID=83868 RepID=UPI00064F864F|nr:hypothetical protein [Palaeococcus ferrophilus]
MKKDEEIKIRKRELIREAYRFGYFIGYHGHTEWVGWVSEKKEEIYERAKELEVYPLVRDAFRRGRIDGERQRIDDINRGVAETGRAVEEEEKPRVKVEARPITEEEGMEEEFKSFLASPRIIEPPEILSMMKVVGEPGFMKLPGMLGQRGEEE